MEMKNMSKKVRDQFTWFEVILDGGKKELIIASSLENANNIANDLFKGEHFAVATA